MDGTHRGVPTVNADERTRPNAAIQRSVELTRIPRHVGVIPDGNRRWADARGLARADGYFPGVDRGLHFLEVCRGLGIEEVSVYGFTKENVRRPAEQVAVFRRACTEFGLKAIERGVALRALGDTRSPVFPEALLPYAERRSAGDLRMNLLVNYGWQWDLAWGSEQASKTRNFSSSQAPLALASADIPRVDLVVRWGGRRRLSGFLPVQCAYADFYVIDTLWPEATPEEFLDALAWYEEQDSTLGG